MSPWPAVVAIVAAAVLGFFGFGVTLSLWSSSEDIGDVIIQAGDLTIEMDAEYTWQVTVWTDPGKVPAGMRYESASPAADGSGLIGEVVSGVGGPIPMGGDWTTLDLSFTGTLTKNGDNLDASMTIIPRDLPGTSSPEVSYTIAFDGRIRTFQAGEAITMPLAGVTGTVPIKVAVHLTGSALGIHQRVSADEPGTIDFQHLFDVQVRQVR